MLAQCTLRANKNLEQPRLFLAILLLLAILVLVSTKGAAIGGSSNFRAAKRARRSACRATRRVLCVAQARLSQAKARF